MKSSNYFAKSKKNQLNLKEENRKSKGHLEKVNGCQNQENKLKSETKKNVISTTAYGAMKKKDFKANGKSPSAKYTGTIKKNSSALKSKKEENVENKRAVKRKAEEIPKTPKRLKIEKKMKDQAEALSDVEIIKKKKKNVKVSSDCSDSEHDEYIDKFFSSDEENADLAEDNIDEGSEFTASESESDDSNYYTPPSDIRRGLSFDKLLSYYGQKMDKKKKVVKPKPKQKLEWIEEDNLDSIVPQKVTKTVARLQSPNKKGRKELEEILKELKRKKYERTSNSSSDSEFSSGDDSCSSMSEEDGEGEELTDYSFESGSDDENFLDDEDDDYSNDDDLDDSYDSDDDSDFSPEFFNDNENLEENDDLYIGRGQAKIYEIDDNHVSFNSDYDGAQIVEILPKILSTKEEECPILVMAAKKPETTIEIDQLVSRNLDELFNKSAVVSTDLDEEITVSDIDKTNFKFYNAVDLRIALLIMKADSIYMNGHLTVQVLVGQLEIMGYQMKKNETKTIYAARGFQYLNLTAKPDKNFQKIQLASIFDKLKQHFRATDLSTIETDFDPTVDVLVLLQSDASNYRVNSVQRFMNDEKIFPSVNSLKNTEFSRTEQLLHTQFYTKTSKFVPVFRKNDKWDMMNVKKTSKIILAGGKGVGKSTICQYLINRNVNKFKKILLIDLDIGQPILGVPETINATLVDGPIFGLGCFERYTPLKSYLFGNLDVVSSPIKYIHAVKQLIEFCSKMDQLKDIPWVVNTMGYVTGFGEELMAAILKFLSPTNIIQILNEKQYFKNLFTSSFVNKYSFNILREEVQSHMKVVCKFETHQIETDFQKERRRGYLSAPATRRDVIILSHLADILKDNALWFTDVKPYKLNLADIEVLIMKEDDKPPKEMLGDVLNANLIYLCCKGSNRLELEFYALGIVRAVDRERNIAIITSLPSAKMKNVNCLAVCSSTLPKSILFGQNPKILENVSYLSNKN